MTTPLKTCPADAPLTRLDNAENKPIKTEDELIAAKNILQKNSSSALPEEAICTKNGDYYLNLSLHSPLEQIAPRQTLLQDPKAGLIDEILGLEIQEAGYKKIIPESEKEISEALKGLAQLRKEGIKKVPTEELLSNAGRSALMFGVVVALFHDALNASIVFSKSLQGVYSFFTEQEALAEFLKYPSPCGAEDALKDLKPNMPPFPLSEAFKRSWKPAITLIALTSALIALDRFRVKHASKKEDEATFKMLNERATRSSDSTEIGQSLDSLESMSLADLQALKRKFQNQIQADKKRANEIQNDLSKVYQEIVALNLAELETRDLNNIQSPEMKALALAVLKKRSPQERLTTLTDWISNLKLKEGIEIGIGFGVGTTLLGKGIKVSLARFTHKTNSQLNVLHQAAKDNAIKTLNKLCIDEENKKPTPVFVQKPAPIAESITNNAHTQAHIPWYKEGQHSAVRQIKSVLYFLNAHQKDLKQAALIGGAGIVVGGAVLILAKNPFWASQAGAWASTGTQRLIYN